METSKNPLIYDMERHPEGQVVLIDKYGDLVDGERVSVFMESFSQSRSISALQVRAYRQSAEAGFHDGEPTEAGPERLANDAMKMALIHSEVSEALEELRAGYDPRETVYRIGHASFPEQAYSPEGRPLRKPEGVPSEMADIVIRVLDYCGSRGIDLESMILEKLDYNATRGKMHGGKSF